jgi:arabinogalactan oligomer / maltooligosaccharide transport system permease protein
MLIPWAMPQYIAAFGWSFILNQNYGIINQSLHALHLNGIPWTNEAFWALFAVIMVNVWLGVPFYVVTLLGGLQNIPGELLEAASIDGASAWQRFRYVTLPLLRPIASLVVLLDAIWTFNVFSVIYFITGGAPGHASDTIISFAYEQPISHHFYGLGSTYGVIILVILLIFTVGYSRALRTTQGVN